METQSAEIKQEMTSASNQQFYGLTDDSRIILLPLASYPVTALRLYIAACAEKEETPANIPLMFNVHQYRSVLSAVDAELNDVDGDGMIPTYMVVPYSSQQAVFPHPSVDTSEEALEFIASFPIEVVGPIELTVVRDTWPKVDEPVPVESAPVDTTH